MEAWRDGPHSDPLAVAAGHRRSSPSSAKVSAAIARFVVSSTQDAVEVPITEADVPNIYVSVLLVKGRTAEELTANGTDAGQPSYRVGYTELSVDDSSKRLRVDVSADRQEYLPRQPLTVSVAVSGADGKAAPAEVTLWAVDYGLLSLTNYKTPDVVKAIYLRKALQVMTVDNRQRLMSRRPTGEFGGILGGVMGGMVGDTGFDVQASMSRLALVGSPQTRPLDTEVRQDFRPLVFWLGSATTDADGRATTTVTLPDSLTTYRIMAVAGKRASQFGFGEREVRVAKPLTLLTAFPRFLNQGDRASFGAVVTNSGKEGGTAVVTIESLAPDILHFDGSAAQTLKIAAGASIPVRFECRGPGQRQCSRAYASSRSAQSTTRSRCPWTWPGPCDWKRRPPTARPSAPRPRSIALPAGLVPGAGGLTVELASTALVGLGEAARYLDEYPLRLRRAESLARAGAPARIGPGRCFQARQREARRVSRRWNTSADRPVPRISATRAGSRYGEASATASLST